MSTEPTIDERIAEEASRWRSRVDSLSAAIVWSPKRHHLLPVRARLTRRPAVMAGAIVSLAIVLTLTLVLGHRETTDRQAPSADCAAPTLSLVGAGEPPITLNPGQVVSVVGRFWVNGCKDTPFAATPLPLGEVHLVLTDSHGDTSLVALAHPQGDEGTFAIDGTIPLTAHAGRATLADADGLALAAITVQVR